MKINNIESIRAFIILYQEKTFTNAAKKLKISKAALSNKISKLEEDLGVSLFNRSTRVVSKTSEGEILYKNAVKLFDSIKEFENSFLNSDKMEGKIHLTCPQALATSFLSKLIFKFMQKNEHIKIELTVTDSYLDLIENNIDLAMRVGNLVSSTLYGKKLGANKMIFAASPSYLLKQGVPKTIQELYNHRIAYLDIHEKLQFNQSKLKLEDFKNNRYFLSNHSSVINQFAIEGGGIIVRSKWDLKNEISSGLLQEIQFDSSLEDYGFVWLLTTNKKLESTKIKALFGFISENWKILQ